MTILEKVSYLKGLIEGANLEKNAENKIITEIVDILAQLAEESENHAVNIADLQDYAEELDDDLAEMEDILGVYDEEGCGCGCGCGDSDDEDIDFDEYDDEDLDDEEGDEDEDEEAPSCGCGHKHED